MTREDDRDTWICYPSKCGSWCGLALPIFSETPGWAVAPPPIQQVIGDVHASVAIFSG